jgi:hypothetical protein
MFTPEALKTMAARCVVDAQDGNLTGAITKQAMDNELNPDQIQRLVEATNQVAYLSQLEKSADRTFEFDVAKYDDVMSGMFTKQASVQDTPDVLSSITDIFAEPMEKVATEKEADLEKWGRTDKIKMLKRQSEHGRRRVDHLKEASHDNLCKLAAARDVVFGDPKVLEKVAHFDNADELCKLIYPDGIKSQHFDGDILDVPMGLEKAASIRNEFTPAKPQESRTVFTDSALSDVKYLSETLTMVKAAQAELSELEPKVVQAEGFIKEALAPFLNAAKVTAQNTIKSGKSRAAAAKQSPAASKAKKAYNTWSVADSAAEVSRKTNRKHDAWKSLRG